MGWLFDEDINAPTVDEFKRANIRGVHIEYDLGLGGTLDPDVVEIARKRKRTIITADPTEYMRMPNSKFHNTGGVWILHTKDQKEQVFFLKKAITTTSLYSYDLRKEKKVDIHSSFVKVIDCRSSKETIYQWKIS